MRVVDFEPIFWPYVVGLGAAMPGVSALIEGALARRRRHGAETVKQRAARLATALTETASLVEEMDKEISERHALVEKLREDIRSYQELVDLKESQANAVAQLLREELHKSERASILKHFGLHFLFYVLGIASTIAFEVWLLP